VVVPLSVEHPEPAALDRPRQARRLHPQLPGSLHLCAAVHEALFAHPVRGRADRATLQDTEAGGISDRPGNYVDVFHTNFGICGTAGGLASHTEKWASTPPDHSHACGCSTVLAAGLSLLGYDGLRPVNPVYCMRQDIIDRCGLGKYLLLA